MFKIYEIDSDTDRYYRIVDDDFTTKVSWENCGINPGWAKLLAYCIISEYEKRKLNVAGNLALAFKYYIEQNIKDGNDAVSLDKIINANKESNQYYAKYADEVEKYLLLI